MEQIIFGPASLILILSSGITDVQCKICGEHFQYNICKPVCTLKELLVAAVIPLHTGHAVAPFLTQNKSKVSIRYHSLYINSLFLSMIHFVYYDFVRGFRSLEGTVQKGD